MKTATLEKIAAGLDNTPLALPSTNVPPWELEIARRRWIRAAMAEADIEHCIEDIHEGRVHSLRDIAGMLHCSHNTVWRIFRREPGVIRLKSVYRVPETVLWRVLNEIMQPEGVNEEANR